MNLRIFFDPVSESFLRGNHLPSALFNNITKFTDQFPSLENIDMAIVGITEYRGSYNNTSICAADEIRAKLYALTQLSKDIRIVDLGNLRMGISVDESHLRIKEVCETLLQKNIFPIFIGGSHDNDYGQVMGYEYMPEAVNLLNIDAYIDFGNLEETMDNKSHTGKILFGEKNIIFHFAHLGYQTYLNNSDIINIFEKLNYEAYRLGELRENFQEIEPVIRNAHALSFDITAIKSTDAPGNKYALPFGLTGEEACQICWYAGLSSKLSSAGFYEYDPAEDIKGKTAGVIATMIWYLMEGYSLRDGNYNFNSPEYVKYVVSISQQPYKLVFYKNSKTEKWVMEIPYSSNKAKHANSAFVPCSYSDYVKASDGIIPARWILMEGKLK